MVIFQLSSIFCRKLYCGLTVKVLLLVTMETVNLSKSIPRNYGEFLLQYESEAKGAERPKGETKRPERAERKTLAH